MSNPKSAPSNPVLRIFEDNFEKKSANSTAKNYSDRKERAVADLLTRFKNLVSLAAAPVENGASKEVAATQGLAMEVESGGLVCSCPILSCHIFRLPLYVMEMMK
jgi:hypothetical protein